MDGKFDIRLSAEVQDAQGTIVYKLRGKVMQIRKHVALLDADDNEIAMIKAKVSPIKSQIDLEAADGTIGISKATSSRGSTRSRPRAGPSFTSIRSSRWSATPSSWTSTSR